MSFRTVDEWIAREAIPFSVDVLSSVNGAVDELIASLEEPVELVGFGEPLHGGEEFLVLRNRLFQHLVEAHGYSAIAIESSFPRAWIVNEYVAGRGPAYEDIQDAGFSYGFPRLEANRELVEWMRGYNADWEIVEASLDPAKAKGLSPEATALRIETEELISMLRVRGPELAAIGGEGCHEEAVHYASLARQLLTYHAGLARASSDRVAALLGIRDAMMADNLTYMARRERGRGKVLAFAHNSHLQRGKAEFQFGADLLTWWPAGAHFTAMFGPRFVVIASAVAVSDEYCIGQPEAGTLEALLTSVPGPARFMPTHTGAGLPTSEISALPIRSGSVKNQSYFPLTSKSITEFDWLAVLDESSYTRGAQPLPA